MTSVFGKKMVSFLMKKLTLTLHIFFLENTLIYGNNGYISTVRGGGIAIYIRKSIIGHLIVAANSPENIHDYVCKENEIRIRNYLTIRINQG